MKTAVIYWSGTGNTEAMANAVAEGAGVDALTVSDFSGNIADFDAIAFGCPAMGAEVLEEDEFEPFFTGIESELSGKKVLLFGSYGWATANGCVTGLTASRRQVQHCSVMRAIPQMKHRRMMILQS